MNEPRKTRNVWRACNGAATLLDPVVPRSRQYSPGTLRPRSRTPGVSSGDLAGPVRQTVWITSASRSIFRGELVYSPDADCTFCEFNAPVAQLDRASDFGSEGWGFKSLRVYQVGSRQSSPPSSRPRGEELFPSSPPHAGFVQPPLSEGPCRGQSAGWCLPRV
jgi:hypothetical protein